MCSDGEEKRMWGEGEMDRKRSDVERMGSDGEKGERVVMWKGNGLGSIWEREGMGTGSGWSWEECAMMERKRGCAVMEEERKVDHLSLLHYRHTNRQTGTLREAPLQILF